MAVCQGIMAAETHNIRFIVCRQHPACGILGGHELSLQRVGKVVHTLQSQSCDMLTHNILHGLQIRQDFWTSCRTLQDSLPDRTPGYWFGMHPANYAEYALWRDRLLHRLTPHLSIEQNTYRISTARRFISSCNDLLALLYTLVQVCSGAPARVTELGVIEVRKTAHAARHVYNSNGQLFTITSYHKSRAVSTAARKPIPRFPDSAAAGLLFVFLLIFKPVQVAHIQQVYCLFHTPDPALDCADFLLRIASTPAASDLLCSWFSSVLSSSGFPCETNQYR